MQKQGIDKLINDITTTEEINYNSTLILTKEEKECFLKYFPKTVKEVQIVERNKVYVR